MTRSSSAAFAAAVAFAAALFGMTGAAPAPSPSPAPAPAQMNGDPAKAIIDTDDVARFWAAYDASTPADRKDVFQRRYLDVGSPGLHDFIPHRIQSAQHLADVVDAHPPYYAAVRASTLKVRDMEPAIRRSLVAMARLVDGAVFPPIYFVIGALNSGGTDSDDGLIIGMELEALPPDHPASACASLERTCSVAEPVEKVPFIVAHELTHYEQGVVRRGRQRATDTVLSQALDEGVADYVGSAVSGLPVVAPYMTYGKAHPAEIRTAFLSDRNSTELSEWFYAKPKLHPDWPNDMGYYVGYAIADAYVRSHRDRKAAIRTLIDAADPQAILDQSGYATSR
jgi:hypothetical protein